MPKVYHISEGRESESSVAEPFDRADGFCYTYGEVPKVRKKGTM